MFLNKKMIPAQLLWYLFGPDPTPNRSHYSGIRKS